MAVVRPVPQIVDLDFDESRFGCLSDDAVVEGALEEVREDGEDVKTHSIQSKRSHECERGTHECVRHNLV